MIHSDRDPIYFLHFFKIFIEKGQYIVCPVLEDVSIMDQWNYSGEHSKEIAYRLYHFKTYNSFSMKVIYPVLQ